MQQNRPVISVSMSHYRPSTLGTYRSTNGQQAVILQNHRLSHPQRPRDPPSLLPVQHHPPEIIVNRMIFPKPQTILRHHIQFPSKHGKGFAIDRVGVTCGVDIGTSFVNFGVYGECRCVDRFIAFDDLTFLIDENEVRHADLGEMLGQRVEPLEASVNDRVLKIPGTVGRVKKLEPQHQ
jgi:hypothetical protein